LPDPDRPSMPTSTRRRSTLHTRSATELSTASRSTVRIGDGCPSSPAGMRLSLVDRHHRRRDPVSRSGVEVDEPGVGHLEVSQKPTASRSGDLSAEPCRHDGSVRDHDGAVAEFGDCGSNRAAASSSDSHPGTTRTGQVSVNRVHEFVPIVVPGSLDLTRRSSERTAPTPRATAVSTALGSVLQTTVDALFEMTRFATRARVGERRRCRRRRAARSRAGDRHVRACVSNEHERAGPRQRPMAQDSSRPGPGHRGCADSRKSRTACRDLSSTTSRCPWRARAASRRGRLSRS
jgi:hypothetical protein